MTIPSMDALLVPILEMLAEAGRELSFDEIEEKLARQFNVSDVERERRHRTSNKRIFRNSRVGWAKDFLKQEGFAEFPKRKYVCITGLGQMLLADNPGEVNRGYLLQWKEMIKGF